MRVARSGFTMVETLIFLAVSGVIFTSVAFMISGQLDKYQSRDAVDQLESVVRNTLNDVTNGYYPMTGTNFSCAGGSGGAARGKNQGCVFAGKSITFQSNAVSIDTLVVNIPLSNPSKLPSTSDLTKINGLNEIKDYKWGIKPTSFPITYYILNTIYSIDSTDNFVSGQQNVQLFYADGLELKPVDTLKSKVCLMNGDHNSSLNFGTQGTLTVSSQFKDEGC